MSALDETSQLTDAHWPWLMAAFVLDADRAFAWLARRLAEAPASDRRQVAESLGANLFNRRQHGIVVSRPDYTRPGFLRRFLPWLIENVRPEDDVDHDGPYSPGRRDDAERLRSVLVEQPSSAAAAAVTRADGCVPSTSPGIVERSMPVAASIASDHSRRATSSHSVPEASDMSLHFLPVKLQADVILRQQHARARGRTPPAHARGPRGALAP